MKRKDECETNGVVRKLAKRPGREPGDGLWVQLPPTLLDNAECGMMNDEQGMQVFHLSSFTGGAE